MKDGGGNMRMDPQFLPRLARHKFLKLGDGGAVVLTATVRVLWIRGCVIGTQR